MKYSKQEIERVTKELKELVKPSTVLYILITKVAPSGMSRRMKVKVWSKKDNRFLNITYDIGVLCGLSENENGLLITGCGMDMTFWLADYITSFLFKSRKQKGLMGNGGNCLKWEVLN